MRLKPHHEYYRVLVACNSTRQVLASQSARGFRLPLISIPRWSRSVKEVHAILESLFGFPVAVVDVEAPSDGIGFVLAETFRGTQLKNRREFRAVEVDSLQQGELSAAQRQAIESFGDRRSAQRGPFFRSGWFENAVDWVRELTGGIHGPAEITQFNASGFTVLARIKLPEATYWLKAVAPQVNSEYRFTKELSRLFPRFLPGVVSFRDSWHAVLMQDGGTALSHQQCTLQTIGAVALSLAQLQLSSVNHTKRLLALGMADVRGETVRTQIRASLPMMERSLDVQDFGGAARISLRKLHAMCDEVERLCEVQERLRIPDTLLHNDLHAENIVLDQARCAFIDWASPAVGNPLLAYHQIRSEFRHRPRLYARLSITYKTALRQLATPHQLDRAVAVLPGFAAAVELQQCLVRAGTSQQIEYHSARRIRSLIRHLVRELEMADEGYQRRYA